MGLTVAPLNCIPYTGTPLDGYDSDIAQQSKLIPKMIHRLEQSIIKELDGITSATKHGIFVSRSAATKIVGLLMGLYQVCLF